MASRAVCVIATDVDGTLFNSCHEIPPSAAAAAKVATAAGVPVVLCTGKMCGPWSERVVPALALGTYAVYNNGGLIVDRDGVTVYEMALEPELVRQRAPALTISEAAPGPPRAFRDAVVTRAWSLVLLCIRAQ